MSVRGSATYSVGMVMMGKTRRTVQYDLCTLLGYLFFIAQSGLVPVSSASPAAIVGSYTSPLGALLQLESIIIFFLMGWFVHRENKNARNLLVRFVIAVYVLGYGLLLVSSFVQSDTLLLISRLIVNSGVSCSLVVWVDIFYCQASECAKANLLAGSLGAALLTCAISTLVSSDAFLELSVGFSALYVVFLVLSHKKWQGPEAALKKHVDLSKKSQVTDKKSSALRDESLFPWVSLCCALLLVLVGPMMAFGALNHAFTSKIFVVVINMSLVAAVVILAIWFRAKQEMPTVRQLYLGVFPVLATALILLFFFGLPLSNLFCFVSYTAYNLVSLVIVFESLKRARATQKSPMCLYGVFVGCVYGVSALGAWGGQIAGTFFMDNRMFSSMILLMIYVLSIFAFLVLLKGKDSSSEGSREGDRPASIMSPAEVEAVQLDVVEAQCKSLAVAYSLTDREGEILNLLAHGNSVPGIAAAMYLSKETIRTHVKSIYRRLDVHSRQELVNLVAQAAAEQKH